VKSLFDDKARGGNIAGAVVVGKVVPSGCARRASRASCSTAAASCITAACARSPRPRVRPASSSEAETARTVMYDIREKIDPSQLELKDTVVSINRVTRS